MRYFFSMMVVLVISFFVTIESAEAKEFDWQGTQIQMSAVGNLNMNESGSVQLHSQFTGFFVPSADVALAFLYVGPNFNVHKAFWIAPHVGAALNWLPSGKDMADFSIWMGGIFLNDRMAYFIESDFITDFMNHDYYGFYSLDYNTVKLPFNHGLHGEQVGTSVMFGPHSGYTFVTDHVSVHLELQYYVGMQDENFGHAVRALFVISGN